MQSVPSSGEQGQHSNQKIYWQSSLGSSLREAIQEVFFPQTDNALGDGGDDMGGIGQQMPQQDKTPEHLELEKKIMFEFDLAVKKKFDELPQTGASIKTKLQGECKDYNNCDDVWKFALKECEIKGESMHERSSNLLIVTMPAKMDREENRHQTSHQAHRGVRRSGGQFRRDSNNGGNRRRRGGGY